MAKIIQSKESGWGRRLALAGFSLFCLTQLTYYGASTAIGYV